MLTFQVWGDSSIEGNVIMYLVTSYSFISLTMIVPIIFSLVSLVDLLLWVSWSNVPARDFGLTLSRTQLATVLIETDTLITSLL